MNKKKLSGEVIQFSSSVCTNSQVQDTHHKKTLPKKTLVPEDEFKSDLENLSATALKQRYQQEYNSWKNRKAEAKKKGLEFDPALSDWRDFLRSMGQAEETGFTVDRIDNDKGYLVGNVRWASKTTQGNNKSNNKTLTVDGITRTVAEWAKITGTSVNTIRDRLKKPGWSDYEVVYGKAPGPPKPQINQSQWDKLRPPDLPEGQEWPPKDHLEWYEEFTATSASTLKLWVGKKEKEEAPLPPSVWLAAALGYRCRLLSKEVSSYLCFPCDPAGSEVPPDLEAEFDRYSARVQEVYPLAIDWCMETYKIDRSLAFQMIQTFGKLT